MVILLDSCASSNVVSDASASAKKNKQTEQKLRFDDWKYKGFGNDLALWVEPAIENKVSAVKKICPELADKEIKIYMARGENSDQAEQLIKEQINLEKETVTLKYFDGFWVRENLELKDSDNSKPYISVYVYIVE